MLVLLLGQAAEQGPGQRRQQGFAVTFEQHVQWLPGGTGAQQPGLYLALAAVRQHQHRATAKQALQMRVMAGAQHLPLHAFLQLTTQARIARP
ncbi:hypothetical protein D3C76_1394570 [compost metagenome]